MSESVEDTHWKEDGVTRLLTEFYRQEMPDDLRSVDAVASQSEMVGNTSPTMRRFATVISAIVVVLMVAALLQQQPRETADATPRSLPVNSPGETPLPPSVPVLNNEPPPAPEVPEWDIEVFPIEEDAQPKKKRERDEDEG